MDRLPTIALTVSVSLHAAARAFVLAHAGAPQQQPTAIAVEVIWGGEGGAPSHGATRESSASDVAAVEAPAPHHPPLSSPGLTRKPSSDPSARDPVSIGKTATGTPGQAQGRQSLGGEGGTAPARTGSAAPRAPETIETAESRRRRQTVATASLESRYAHSGAAARAPTQPKAAAETGGEASGDLEQGREGGTRNEGGSVPGSSKDVADGGETVYRVAPSYPAAARRRGIEGTVRLRVRFDADGRPEDVAVAASSGSEMLDHAARDAVRRWRFRGGAAGAIDVPIAFRLRGTDAVQMSDTAREG
jgi:TonB family protein